MPKTIEEMFEDLRLAIVGQTEVRERQPGRVVSRKAKNVMPGMTVEDYYGNWMEITGVTRFTDSGRVVLSDGKGRIRICSPENRVRTRTEA